MKYKNMMMVILAVFSLNYGLHVSAMQSCTPEEMQLLGMCERGDLEGVANLVAKGVNVNCADDYERRPLLIACQLGYKNLVRYLVEHDANIFAGDPRNVALRAGHKDIVQYLDNVLALLRANSSKGGVGKEQQIILVSGKRGKGQQNQNSPKNEQKPAVQQTQKNQQVNQVNNNNNNTQKNIQKAQQSVEDKAEPKMIVVSKEEGLGEIEDYSQRSGFANEIYIFRDVHRKQAPMAPGIYYKTADGLKLVDVDAKSNDGAKMLQNQLSDLSYSPHVRSKMYIPGDTHHNFPEIVEQQFGEWARVIIDNPINNPEQIFNGNQKFDLYITIPGKMVSTDYASQSTIQKQNELGVFEFFVRKNPYQKKGSCMHRFFNPKGTVGAQGFGADFRANEQALTNKVPKQELTKKPEKITQEEQVETSNKLQVLRAANKALPLEPKRHENTIFISDEGSLAYIQDYSQHHDYYNEIYVNNQRKNTVAPGIYYHTPNGLKPVPVQSRKKAPKMLQNQLSDLSFTAHVNKKMHMKGDTFHNFPEIIEKEFGQWARVVIGNAANNPQEIFDTTKKFDLYITIPGKMSEIDYLPGGTKKRENTRGVFEFVVHKSPYEKKGLCLHRFFNPRGIVAADLFGAEARAEGLQELTKFDLLPSRY